VSPRAQLVLISSRTAVESKSNGRDSFRYASSPLRSTSATQCTVQRTNGPEIQKFPINFDKLKKHILVENMSVRRHLIRNNTAVTSVKSGSFGGVKSPSTLWLYGHVSDAGAS